MTKKNAKCPICGRPGIPEQTPFCSARCKDVDLNRWLGGVYAIPGESVTLAAGADLDSSDEDQS